ncbi:MAG: cyclic nucleotide-binding/CBS domain-containing protein [Candidatus Hadarchaeota archaeon]
MPKYPPEYYDMEVPIRRFLTRTLIGIDQDESVQKAARRMVEFGISSIVVLNESEDIVGIFTDSDIKKKVAARGLKPDISVKNIMTTDLTTIDIEADVKKVTKIMTEKKIKHVLVEEEGEIVGILSFGDLIGMERRKLETYISRE